ncbi:nucleotidyl transferase AbiEii/AbiGii toxin family protein [Synechococcus sp. CBW1108]|uniref:nucleotidyl transferase AbiEii/AbiGii toxin family protein n=1 Tax=Synechococcus sp. CBW1108 TaxID=1353147 RepID=UPI0018CE76E7|nr:nucleotidyl transferase AbiEii/AbiGii toxin family protein [Synechococcus sp. CBW1108]QPN70052.1 nucleotidyl transferase AbiEii/AbiGii toxin family protein [Synechococcus sp. CBW1108]
MNGVYTATVRQLLDIAPVVFESPNFAIKGGTALNLFLHDLPRLSVDIDVVFTDHTLDRATALQAISSELRVISDKLEAMGHEVLLHRNSANNESKLKVMSPLAEVKVEVNEVFRGTLLPLQQRSLSPATEEEFAQAVTLPLLATAELYGSKLVAAMDRQHPGDLFDVHVLYNDMGLTPEIVDCFVVYLASHNRPVHEVLKPRLHPLEATFANQFDGMTRAEISLDTLEQTREGLVQDLPRALTDQHRTFLLSLVQNQPRWECMPFAHLKELPAIRWKLQNLAKLKGAKRAEQLQGLEACFQQEEGLR